LHENPKIINNKKIVLNNLINYVSYIIVNKNIKLNIKNFDFVRFNKYYNNILWCLKKYKVINDETNYVYENIEDNNKVINIYNFIYSL
jgi:transcriptional regulator of heat shock response